MIKLLRTIRFDASDTRIFQSAAAPDEWAVSGAFEFADLEPVSVAGKTRQAFANGFLGLASFGRATFATVAEADGDTRRALEHCLAAHFVARYGAPGLEAALPVAEQELAFVADLCREVAINTVFTVRRRLDSEGAIREEFRTIRAPSGEPQHARIWKGIDDE